MLRQLALDRATGQKVNLVHESVLIENDLQKKEPKMNEPALPAPKPRPGKEPCSVSERLEAIAYNEKLSLQERIDLIVSIDWSRFRLTP